MLANFGDLLRINPPTAAQRDASRQNGQLGGRPRRKKPVFQKQPKYLYKIICRRTRKVMYVGITETPQYRFAGHEYGRSAVGKWMTAQRKNKRPCKIWLSRQPIEYERALALERKTILFYKSIGQAEFNATDEPSEYNDSGF